MKFAQDVRDDPLHPLRKSIDEALLQLSNDLRFDPDMQYKAEQAKIRMLDHPEVNRTLQTSGTVAKEMLLRAMDDPTSDLRRSAGGFAGERRTQSDREAGDAVTRSMAGSRTRRCMWSATTATRSPR